MLGFVKKEEVSPMTEPLISSHNGKLLFSSSFEVAQFFHLNLIKNITRVALHALLEYSVFETAKSRVTPG